MEVERPWQRLVRAGLRIWSREPGDERPRFCGSVGEWRLVERERLATVLRADSAPKNKQDSRRSFRIKQAEMRTANSSRKRNRAWEISR